MRRSDARAHGRGRVRAAERGLTMVEGAVLVSIVGTLLAVGVPAFVRELHASRFVEPIDGLARVQAGAVAYAHAHAGFVADALPPSAPLTPTTPPRGTRAADAPGTWDTPTWRSLGFRPVDDGVPHAYAFGFDADKNPTSAHFRAHAHGDLDGDGVTSTFEVTGHTDSPGELTLDPGMYVADELE